MSRRRSRSQLDAMDQINVTPLLDLTFLLLIVFMISMPLMQYGVDVTPPSMKADPLPESQMLNVALQRDGTIIFRNTPITSDALIDTLKQALASNKDAVVLLSGDQERSYGDVIGLLRTIRASGITRVKLVTNAE